jgi:predicted nucleic acid-binding protein
MMKLGLRPKDSLHIAYAIHAAADYFLTTDKKILNKPVIGVQIVNPVDFARRH